MYSVAHFRQDDPEALRALVESRPLAVLVTFGAGRLHVSHVPLLFQPEPAPHGRFLGHLARANPQAANYDAGVEAVAVFSGPDAYVSPSGYATKRIDGNVVPTWNYAAVYAFGSLAFTDDPEITRQVVSQLTGAHEAARDAPWAVDDAPEDYVQKLLGAIRAFEFRIARIEGKWKLSQNRSPADRAGVMQDLASGAPENAAGVLAMMRGLYPGTPGD